VALTARDKEIRRRARQLLVFDSTTWGAMHAWSDPRPGGAAASSIG